MLAKKYFEIGMFQYYMLTLKCYTFETIYNDDISFD